MGFFEDNRPQFLKIAVAITMIVFASFVGNKFKNFLEDENAQHADYKLIREFLLNDDTLPGAKNKPPLWIHLPYEVNARVWQSFGSRNTTNLNQNYLHFTIKTIIANCGRDMNICLIDDYSFARLLPKDPIIAKQLNIADQPEPFRSYYRTVAMLKLVYNYGGIIVPESFLCLQNLAKLFSNTTSSFGGGAPFVAENRSLYAYSGGISAKTGAKNSIAGFDVAPDIRFFGCKRKKNSVVKELIAFAEKILLFDDEENSGSYLHPSAEPQFLGSLSQWCLGAIQTNMMQIIPADRIGVMTANKRLVDVDTLFNNEVTNMLLPRESLMGIWIPSDSILRRIKYQWFPVVSVEHILEGDYLLAAYFRVAAERVFFLVEEGGAGGFSSVDVDGKSTSQLLRAVDSDNSSQFVI